MPFQILDIVLVGIMLISGFLALMRGFVREVFAIVSWGGAVVAAYIAFDYEPLRQLASQYIESETFSRLVIVGAVFLVTLVIFSLITMKLADWILDSGIGALDRTLGFVFGLARGLLLVAVAYIFFIYWIPQDQFPKWVSQAKTLRTIDHTSTYIIAVLPNEIQEVLIPKTIEGRRDAGTGKQDRGSLGPMRDGDGLKKSNRQEMNQTIQNQQSQ